MNKNENENKNNHRTLKIIVLVVLVVIGIIAANLFFFGEHLIRNAVESAASSSMGTQVRMQDIGLDLTRGNVSMGRLTVANMPDFHEDNIITLNRGFVDTVGMSAIFAGTVRVNEIRLEGVEVFVEQTGMRNNLRQMLDQMPARQDPEGPEQTEGRDILVDRVHIEDIVVNMRLQGLNNDSARTIRLEVAPITIEDLGTDQQLNSGAIAARITAAIIAGVLEQIAGQLPGEIVEDITQALGDTIDLGKIGLGEVLEQLNNVFDLLPGRGE